MSAVESGPPETASRRRELAVRSPSSASASDAETGVSSSAFDTLLFPLDALLHGDRGARIFAADLAESGAGRFLLVERGQRLAEPQQRVRCLAGGVVFRRDGEERFGGVMIPLALEQRLAEPIMRVGGETVARILLQETAKALFGERIVLAQHIAVSEVVLVLRRIARCHHHLLTAGRVGIAWWRGRQRPACAWRQTRRHRRFARRPAEHRKIERRA